MTEKPVSTSHELVREGMKTTSRNFFQHIHDNRIYPDVLNPSMTFGLGVILVSLFIIQMITGILLMVHYTPSVESAYYSVKEIIFYIPGGRVIRNIHRWAAHSMVLVTFLHLFRTFYTGAYSGFRRTNWVIGVVMLLVVMMMSFSGYLLPWDQLAYWAVTIGSNIAGSFREVTDLLEVTEYFDPGGFFKNLLIGGEEVGQSTLTRFFALHVLLLPVTLLALSGYHFWRIRKDGGLARPKDHLGEKTAQIPAWPLVFQAELAIFLTILALLLITGVILDAPLKIIANPNLPENPAKSPWYLLGIQEIVSYSAFMGGFVIPLLFLTFLFSIPWLDRHAVYPQGTWFSGKNGFRITWLSTLLCGVLTVMLVILSEWIILPGSPGSSFSILLTMIVNPGTLAVLGYVIWAWLVFRSTCSRRMAVIALFTSFMTGWTLFMIIGIWFRGENWMFGL